MGADDPLVTWLRATLDEIERVARAADAAIDVEDGRRRWYLDEPDTWPGAGYVNNDYVCVGPEIAPHIFLHDPRAVLARVEAERAIVEWCVEVIGDRDLTRYGEFGSLRDDPSALAVTLAVETLRNLARGHRHDAPGFDPAWAPEGVGVDA